MGGVWQRTEERSLGVPQEGFSPKGRRLPDKIGRGGGGWLTPPPAPNNPQQPPPMAVGARRPAPLELFVACFAGYRPWLRSNRLLRLLNMNYYFRLWEMVGRIDVNSMRTHACTPRPQVLLPSPKHTHVFLFWNFSNLDFISDWWKV